MNRLITKTEYIRNISDLMNYDSFVEFMNHPTQSLWDEFEQEFDDDNYDYARGATKGVIIPINCDYVLKFPFLFTDRYDYRNNTYTELPSMDYCRCEWRNYLMAKQQGLEECFAAMEYIDEVFDTPVYAQEKCDCDEYEVSDEMYRTSYRSFLDEMGYEDNEDSQDEFCFDECSDTVYEALIYEKWDCDIAADFINFCEINCINDLHSGNWSLSGDTLKVVDYSGYDLGKLSKSWFDICKVA